MFHISDCRKYRRCPRLFVMAMNTEEKEEYRQFVRLDETVTDLAMERIGVRDPFVGQRNDRPELALEAMKTHDWLVKARFEYEGLRIKVPFLHRTENGWDLYFLFVGLYPQGADMFPYCALVWVLAGLGIEIGEIRMIHLDAEYVREGELDLQKLFCISDCLYNRSNNPTVPLKETILAKMEDLRPLLSEMEAARQEEPAPAVRSSKCTGRQKCRFYAQCFPDEEGVSDDSILTLIASQNRYDMQKEGKLCLKDADPERIEGSPQQYAQIQADMNGGLFLDKMALKGWLKDIVYPITFLDFEWERYAIPPYDGMKPYQVLPFEYSLHIVGEDGSVEHKVFLSVHDDREEFAASLVRDVPEAGTLIAYNSEGAEVIRINELAERFPRYRDRLLDMNRRMIDLQVPFLCGWVYDVRMRGSWTLKQIMSMMDDPGYSELEIREGMDAVYQWRRLDRGEEGFDASAITEDLKKYCGMDSWAMVVVFRWLQKLTAETQ